jgi:hypothetical protein
MNICQGYKIFGGHNQEEPKIILQIAEYTFPALKEGLDMGNISKGKKVQDG